MLAGIYIMLIEKFILTTWDLVVYVFYVDLPSLFSLSGRMENTIFAYGILSSSAMRATAIPMGQL